MDTLAWHGDSGAAWILWPGMETLPRRGYLAWRRYRHGDSCTAYSDMLARKALLRRQDRFHVGGTLRTRHIFPAEPHACNGFGEAFLDAWAQNLWEPCNDTVAALFQPVMSLKVFEVPGAEVDRDGDGHCKHILLVSTRAAWCRRELHLDIILALLLVLMLGQEVEVANVV